MVRLLAAKQDRFLDEAREVLRAGLSSAAWITVDDTSARHKAKNGFCTHIGNDRFACYWLRVFDFGCSAKYSVGRMDMRNPRRTPITVGNRMFG